MAQSTHNQLTAVEPDCPCRHQPTPAAHTGAGTRKAMRECRSHTTTGAPMGCVVTPSADDHHQPLSVAVSPCVGGGPASVSAGAHVSQPGGVCRHRHHSATHNAPATTSSPALRTVQNPNGNGPSESAYAAQMRVTPVHHSSKHPPTKRERPTGNDTDGAW